MCHEQTVLPAGVPDRVSIEKTSPYFYAPYKTLGVMIGDKVLNNVVEFCASKGWLRLQVNGPRGKPKMERGRWVTIKKVTNFTVYFREGKHPTSAAYAMLGKGISADQVPTILDNEYRIFKSHPMFAVLDAEMTAMRKATEANVLAKMTNAVMDIDVPLNLNMHVDPLEGYGSLAIARAISNIIGPQVQPKPRSLITAEMISDKSVKVVPKPDDKVYHLGSGKLTFPNGDVYDLPKGITVEITSEVKPFGKAPELGMPYNPERYRKD